MTSWGEFTHEQPELAGRVLARLRAHRHLTMATLRADGGPRICGTELRFFEDGVFLAGMPGARRWDDLRRDPRVAVHSASEDPDVWTGDARLTGRAEAVPEGSEEFGRFRGAMENPPDRTFELWRIDLAEVVAVGLTEAEDAMVIESWRPGRGVREARRA